MDLFTYLNILIGKCALPSTLPRKFPTEAERNSYFSISFLWVLLKYVFCSYTTFSSTTYLLFRIGRGGRLKRRKISLLLLTIDWMQIPTSCLMHIHDAPNCLSNRLNMFWFVRTQTNRQNFWMDRYLDFFPKKFPKLALDQLYQSEYTFLLQMLKTKIRRITWFKVKHILLHTN